MLDRAFDGTRVIEIASGLPAGITGRFFSDLGAEVVRAEWLTSQPERPEEMALRDWTRLGKRTLGGPGREPATVAEVLMLMAEADLVITDLPPGRWPATLPTAEAISAAHPGLVVLDVTSFGRTGPYASFLGGDLVELGLAGYLYVCGLNDREPIRIGIPGVVDIIAGVNAAGGAMIALHHARATGQGQVVDVTRLETMVGSALTYATNYSMGGAVRRRSPTPFVSVGALVPAMDGHVLISTFRASSEILSVEMQDERLLEERFADSVGRERNQQQLYEIFCEALAKRSKAEVFRTGQELRLQNAMVQSPWEIVDCPQHAERHFFQGFRLTADGEITGPSLPVLPPEARARLAGARPQFTDTATWERPRPEAPHTPTTAPPLERALDGLHVLELTFAWAGPFMGRILADNGAEVVKIESRYHPDTARGADQVDLSFGDNGRWLDRSPSYMISALGKHHLGMELTEPAGREVLLDLVRWADVLIENFTPRVLPNLGFDWDVLQKVNPRLVMMSATGFGQQGPYRNYGAWGWGLESQGGVTYSNGYFQSPDPLCFMPTIPDSFAATTGLTAIMAALEERRRTGEGQRIDLSQYECATFATLPELLRAQIARAPRARLGNRHPWMAPQGVYPCEGFDEWVAIAISSDEQWRALCGVIGRDDLGAEEDLAGHEGRQRSHDRIDEAITAWTSGRTKHEAMYALQAGGVPAGAVQNSKELQHDPQLLELDYWRTATATETGLRVYPGPWHRPRRTPPEIARGPADFGEDNERVLRDVLRYDEAKVRRIVESGVLSHEQEGVIRPPTPGLPVEVQLERKYIRSWDADYLALPEQVRQRHEARRRLGSRDR